MPFICEDVGTTKRGRMTPTRALKAWERTGGVCVNCGLKIDGTKADWFAEHIRALELGGSDADDNLGPAHWACKRDKDAADHASAAKAKRNKRAELGIRNPTKIESAGFPRFKKQARASSPLTKTLPSRRNVT